MIKGNIKFLIFARSSPFQSLGHYHCMCVAFVMVMADMMWMLYSRIHHATRCIFLLHHFFILLFFYNYCLDLKSEEEQEKLVCSMCYSDAPIRGFIVITINTSLHLIYADKRYTSDITSTSWFPDYFSKNLNFINNYEYHKSK